MTKGETGTECKIGTKETFDALESTWASHLLSKRMRWGNTGIRTETATKDFCLQLKGKGRRELLPASGRSSDEVSTLWVSV